MLWKLFTGRCLCDRTRPTEGRAHMNELGGGMRKLTEFVSKQRARFTDETNNVFAFSWAKVFRRWQFMEIVYPRYETASAAYVTNTKSMGDAVRDLPSGRSTVSAQVEALHDEARCLNLSVQLEVESYYLFAKIVLDDVARAIEYYFGPEQRLSLDSHDDLHRCFRAYAAAKGLSVSEALIASVGDLKIRVCDYRDQQIAHEKSPRTMHGTLFENGIARPVLTRLYPRETDHQAVAEPLDALRASLDAHFDLVADFLAANETKTKLEVLAAI
jgi:hypothetical protein